MLEYPKWFPTKSPIEKRDIIEKNIRIVPGTCDKEGRIVYIIKVGKSRILLKIFVSFHLIQTKKLPCKFRYQKK